MALYGIVGVQFFGELTYHCVENKTNLNDNKIYINNLMIPDTYCSNSGDGYTCPNGFKCIELKVNRADRGFNGFDEIITSIFTVYEAASQEGWVYLMYRATDSLPSWRALLYFITMIFFLAWLVKNVFIAVIIETFAEIRVQFQQMWGTRGQEASIEQIKIFERLSNGQLKLIVKNENKYNGLAPDLFIKIYQSPLFNLFILGLVLANAIITATIKYTHLEHIDYRMRQTYYYIEIVFTLLFDLEVLFKILCLGFKSYIHRSIHKFEFILALGTTIRLIPDLYQTELTYFQVVRIVRLIKSSPLLEDFTNKVIFKGSVFKRLICDLCTFYLRYLVLVKNLVVSLYLPCVYY
jgi:sodium leak channel non-selective protein